ncbi:hypothetical protein Ancab_026536 [Ancistrocladus abbreviatus]
MPQATALVPTDFPVNFQKLSNQYSMKSPGHVGTLRMPKRVQKDENVPKATIDNSLPLNDCRTPPDAEFFLRLQTKESQRGQFSSPAKGLPPKVVDQQFSRHSLRKPRKVLSNKDGLDAMAPDAADTIISKSEAAGHSENHASIFPCYAEKSEVQPPLDPALSSPKDLSDKSASIGPIAGAVITNAVEHIFLSEATVASNVVENLPEQRSNHLSQEDNNLHRTTSINLTEMAEHLDDDLFDEVDSHNIPLVTVSGYRVKPDLAPTLREIISKYGDIAANCCKQSNILRSSLLENLCEIVQKLKGADIVQLTPIEIDNMLVLLRDIELDQVEVGWLLQRLNEIHEAKQLLKEYRNVKQAQMTTLLLIEKKEKELKVLQDELAIMTDENRNFNLIISITKSKLQKFYSKSLVNDLL